MTYDEAAATICDWMVEHYDRETIVDIANHGCGSGCASGLIYYSECCDFYREFEEELWEILCNLANEFAESPLALLDLYRSQDRGMIETHSQLCCAASWFVVEHLAQTLADNWSRE
jgi:hypothetical protein